MNRKFFILCLVSFCCTACAARKTHFVYEIPRTNICANSPFAQKPQLIESKNNAYFVWTYRGSYFVLGSKSSSIKFKKERVLLSSLKKEESGPNGETVFFENDPGNDDLLKRLEKEFNKPKLMKYQNDDFFVWKIGNYIYLFGDPLTNERFVKFREYPSQRDALYNAGPRGENVIYEIKEKKPDFSKFLLDRYLDGPLLVSQSCDNFTVWKYQQKYYVIGTPEMNLRFETYHEIPNSQAFTSFGPEGETVIFEDVPDNPQFLNYLRNRFSKELDK